jgi:hypothetical protein
MLESPLQMIFNNKKRTWEFTKIFGIRIHVN